MPKIPLTENDFLIFEKALTKLALSLQNDINAISAGAAAGFIPKDDAERSLRIYTLEKEKVDALKDKIAPYSPSNTLY